MLYLENAGDFLAGVQVDTFLEIVFKHKSTLAMTMRVFWRQSLKLPIRSEKTSSNSTFEPQSNDSQLRSCSGPLRRTAMPAGGFQLLALQHLPPQFLLPRVSLPKTTIRTIRSLYGTKQSNSRFNRLPNRPPLESSPAAAHKRKDGTTPYRTGALAIKKGMSGMYDPETGARTPVTVVQMDRVQVVGHKTHPLNGYWAVAVGQGYRHPKNVTRPLRGHFAQQGVAAPQRIVEFRVKGKDGLLDIGTPIDPSWFLEGQFVDVRANCKGKGFAGGMKRHGFAGQPASHGNSKTHRAMGSAGQSQGGGSRVYPGKRMPGRMGGQQVTVQNVKVMKVDKENGLVVLHGELNTAWLRLSLTLVFCRLHCWSKWWSGQNFGRDQETMAKCASSGPNPNHSECFYIADQETAVILSLFCSTNVLCANLEEHHTSEAFNFAVSQHLSALSKCDLVPIMCRRICHDA